MCLVLVRVQYISNMCVQYICAYGTYVCMGEGNDDNVCRLTFSGESLIKLADMS